MFITQRFSIKNHPILQYNKSHQYEYVGGICSFVLSVLDMSAEAVLALDLWSASIWGNPYPLKSCSTCDLSCVRQALKVKREGTIFFVLWNLFFFDVFTIIAKCDKHKLSMAYDSLLVNFCTYFNRRIAEGIYAFVRDGVHNRFSEKLPLILVDDWVSNKVFQKKKVKKILVVATMSAGKSTLINALVGTNINKVKATACTSSIRKIYNSPGQSCAILVSENGYKCTYDEKEIQSGASVMSIGFNSTLSNESLCVIDTPGVNYNRDKSHGEMTRAAIKNNDYDILLFVCNGTQLMISDEYELLKYSITHCKKKIVFAINQCDMYREEDDSIEEAIKDVEFSLRELTSTQYPIIPISAVSALIFRKALNKRKLQTNRDFELDYNLEKRKFEKKYYDFPTYICASKDIVVESRNLIDKTGITYLEKILIQK